MKERILGSPQDSTNFEELSRVGEKSKFCGVSGFMGRVTSESFVTSKLKKLDTKTDLVC